MLSLSLGFANAVSRKSRLASFIKNIKKGMEPGFITGSARLANERLTEKKHGVKPVPKPPKPSVWDLTVMPKISVEHTVQIANEAFPLLDNQYWKTGEAQRIYKQFCMKWSYL